MTRPEMLCVPCGVKQGKSLDIRDGLWREGICPGCASQRLIWPILPKKTANLDSETEGDRPRGHPR